MDRETVKMLDSIRKQLAESKRQHNPKASKPSPYGTITTKQRKRQQHVEDVKSKRVKLPQIETSSNNDTLTSKDDAMVRSIVLPYQDSMMMVSESLRFAKSWSTIDFYDKKIASSPQKQSASVRDTIIKRYPRFFEHIKVKQHHCEAVKLRSDVWLVHVLEGCYDAVHSECNKSVNTDRSRTRHGLDLGAMDTFPHAVARHIFRQHSVVDMAQQFCVDFVYTLNSVIDNTELHAQTEEAISLNSFRAFIFSNFLSEVWDIDILAAFLHTRGVVQSYMNIRLQDMNPPMIHSNNQKIVPIQLPKTMKYVHDYSLPEAPLLSVDINSMTFILLRLVPLASAKLREYFLRKCFFWCQLLLEHRSSYHSLCVKLSNSKLFDTTYLAPITMDNVDVVPIYVLLLVVCYELKTAPEPKQQNQLTSAENLTPLDTNLTLAQLNSIYENDNALLRSLKADIHSVEMELSHVEADLLKQEKKLRLLERRWKDDDTATTMTASTAASDYIKKFDVDEISDLRVAIAEKKAERSNVQAKLHAINKRYRKVMDNMNSLWATAQAKPMTILPKIGSTVKKRVAKWSDIVAQKVTAALEQNAERAEIATSTEKHLRTMLLDTAASTMSHTIEPESSPTNLSASAMIRSIEQEVQILTALGDGETVEDIYSFSDDESAEPGTVASIEREALMLSHLSPQKSASKSPKSRKYTPSPKRRKKRKKTTPKKKRSGSKSPSGRSSPTATVESIEADIEALASIGKEELPDDLFELEDDDSENHEAPGSIESIEREVKLMQSISPIKTEHTVDVTSVAEQVVTQSVGTYLDRVDRVLQMVDENIIRKHSDNLTSEQVLEATAEKVVSSSVNEYLTRVDRVLHLVDTSIAIKQESGDAHAVDVSEDVSILTLRVDGGIRKSDTGPISSDIEDPGTDDDRLQKSDVLKSESVEATPSFSRSISEAEPLSHISTIENESEELSAESPKNWHDDIIMDIAEELVDIPEFYQQMAEYLFEDMWSTVLNHIYDLIVEEYSLSMIHNIYADVVASSTIGKISRKVIQASRVEHHIKVRNRKICAKCFEWLRYGVTIMKNEKYSSVVKIQSRMRGCLQRQIYQTALKVHQGREIAIRALRHRYNEKQQKYFISSLHWMAQRRKWCDSLTASIRQHRVRIPFQIWCSIYKQQVDQKSQFGAKLGSKRPEYVIYRFLQNQIAKEVAYQRKLKQYRLDELATALPYALADVKTKNTLRYWRKTAGVRKIFNTYVGYLQRVHIRTRFSKWRTDTAAYNDYRIIMANRINATARMKLTQKQSFSYYKLKRGLRVFQAAVRRVIAKKRLAKLKVQNKKAMAIQRIIRGFTTRAQLRAKRIADIHFSVISDNYDRLLYYHNRYYDLCFELDSAGNTVLHNAAKHASKRCIKLLVRMQHDLHYYNVDGYAPLHLLIMSPAVRRDEVFDYMIEHGFQEDWPTYQGKTCLHLAVEYDRNVIAKYYLEHAYEPNELDPDGYTPLQVACANGYVTLVRALLEHGADCNLPGNGGFHPLHDVCTSKNQEILEMLIAHGAYVNVFESTNGYTPLMLAAQYNLPDFVHLILLQGADVNAVDYYKQTAVHHCAYANNSLIVNSLREADADFDALDYHNNTPLHTAANLGSENVVKELLLAGAHPSLQNKDGNQPSHLAAMNNHVNCLIYLVKYDEHMGRMNYNHQTPLGAAKLYLAHDAREFLETHYTKLEDEEFYNTEGTVWWDRDVDHMLDGWYVDVHPDGKRVFVNENTGEVQDTPPVLSSSLIGEVAKYAQLPMRKRILLNDENDEANMHEYKHEYFEMQKEVDYQRKLNASVTIINKFARRKLIYKQLARQKASAQKLEIIARFFRRGIHTLFQWRRMIANRRWTRVQALWRGYSFRQKFYYTQEYADMWYARARRRLALMVYKAWKFYRHYRACRLYYIRANGPQHIYEWQALVESVKYPERVVGIYEEYLYPGTVDIKFYHNSVSGQFSLDMPEELRRLDREKFIEDALVRTQGFAPKHQRLAIKLQSMWRGYIVRKQYEFIVKASHIATTAEDIYLHNPSSDRNLFNYTLYCHTVAQDYDRARGLYVELMKRMQYKGPDVPHILYAYAIFACAVHDADYVEITILLDRARKAEEAHEIFVRKRDGLAESVAIQNGTYTHGKVFDLAHIGFFRYMANVKQNGHAWHNYALCRFLVYNDFNSAFDAFLAAFKSEPANPKIHANYNLMMQAYYGENRALIDEVVNKRMRYLAQRDLDIQTAARNGKALYEKKMNSVKKIQRWYRFWRGLRRMRGLKSLTLQAAGGALPKKNSATRHRQAIHLSKSSSMRSFNR